MQSIARFSVIQYHTALANALRAVRWRKLAADIGLLALAALTCSMLRRG